MPLTKKNPARLKALAFFSLLAIATGASAETLDFRQAVQRALAQNPDIIIAGAQIGQAHEFGSFGIGMRGGSATGLHFRRLPRNQ